MTTGISRDPGQSALSAFRADLPLGGRVLTADDGRFIKVATILRQATIRPGGASSRRLVREATRLATELVGPEALRIGLRLERPGDHPSTLDVFRVAADQCGDVGLNHLQAHIFSSLEALVPTGTVTAARIQLRLVRNVLEFGMGEEAGLVLRALLRSKVANNNTEIRLRARLMIAIIGRNRGNHSLMPLLESIIADAGTAYPHIKASALNQLGVLFAMHKDFNRAFQTGWEGYLIARNLPHKQDAEILCNIAQTLLVSGHPRLARIAFSQVLAMPLAFYQMLPVLSGFAAASAHLGDRAGVEWAVAQVLSVTKFPLYLRPRADALVECAAALELIGEGTRAGTLLRRGIRTAERYGHYDILFAAQVSPARPVAPAAILDSESVAIAEQMDEMEPMRFPHDPVSVD